MVNKRDDELVKQLAARDALGLYEQDIDDRHVDAILARRNDNAGYDEVFSDVHKLAAALDDCKSEWAGDVELMAFAEEERKHFIGGNWVKKVAGVAATVLVSAAVWYGMSIPETVDEPAEIYRYVSRVGELKTVELSDGSVLTLNTNSQALVDMSDDLRRVVLDRGEAYFDIAPDPLRPFTVELAERSVTVLGTEFNVRRSVNGFTLSVLEGSVAVHRKDDKSWSALPDFELDDSGSKMLDGAKRASAGTQVEFNALTSSVVVSRDIDVSRLNGWRRGVLNFDGVSLEEIVSELNRYSGKQIELSEGVDGSQLVYASYQSDRIDLALKGLEFSLPIIVESRFDKIVLRNEENSNKPVGN